MARVKLELWDDEQRERLELSIETRETSDDSVWGTLYRENEQPIDINAILELKVLLAKGNFALR
ncbi:hypothetical protein ES702_04978 [subsurface metagenome]